MLDLGKLREREKRLLQRKAKLESDIARNKAAEKMAARRDDTRRKIVLGGVVIAAIEAGDLETDYFGRLIRRHVAERDKKLFDGGPFAVSGTTESTGADAPDSDLGSGENASL